MVRRGTPDLHVQEPLNTNGSGGGGGGGVVTQGTSPWIVDDPDTQSALATILTELGNILAQLQATLTVAITGEVEVSNDAGNPLPEVPLAQADVLIDGQSNNFFVPRGTNGISESNIFTPVMPYHYDSANDEFNLARGSIADGLEVDVTNSPDLSGVWSYIGDNGAGAGTANVPGGSRVLSAACWTESATTPRYRVNGGDWVSLPTSGDGSIDALANLPGPVAIEFQGTGGFVVTYLT